VTGKFSRLAENTDKIWVFDAPLFLSFMPKMCEREGCGIAKERRDEALSIPSSLCKIFWVKRLAKLPRAVESDANRANRPEVIR
jgi:hypothetical protein